MRQDGIIALAAGLIVFGTALVEGAQAATVTVAGLSVAVSAPLVVRRRAPMTTALLCATVALCGVSVPQWSGKLVAIFAFGSAAYHRPRGGLVFAVSAGWFAASELLISTKPTSTATFSEMILTGIAPVALGYALRLHQERAEQAVRLQRDAIDLAILQERAHVAREVHDSVGHHLTAIRMQATAARHALGETPRDVRTFDTISNLAGTALDEVRTFLHTLRDGSRTNGTSLRDVEELTERLSTPACRITTDWKGPRRTVPALVDHGCYRLVQEAVTNAVRHARATDIRVSIDSTVSRITLVIEDNGPSAPSDAVRDGAGVRGMRERVRLLGGELRMCPAIPHGWRVEATIPIERTRS